VTRFGVFLRGLAMGSADIVPGVSGGTVAFITGIYPTLIAALSRFDLALLGLLRRRQLARAWQHVNGNFLLPLVLGILAAIVSLARLVSWLLAQHPAPVWATFFGLILGSALVLSRHLPTLSTRTWMLFSVGFAIAATLVFLPGAALVPGPFTAFCAGAIAICAMILPGVSGSFILVLLGMYAATLTALREFDLAYLGSFAAGAVLGLLSFTRLLHYLLQHHRATTLATLTGFLGGSLFAVWPWRVDGGAVAAGSAAVRQRLVWPADYAAQGAGDAQLLLCLFLMLLGFVVVTGMDYRQRRQQVGL